MAEQSYLGMSDEELMAMDPGSLPEPEAPPEVVAEIPEEDAAQEALAPTEAAADEAAEEETPDAPDEAEDSPATDEKSVADAVDKEAPEGETPTEPDYQAEYKRLLAPFKANGKDIAVTSVDDAISLMQMGANYNKKMAGLKPNLKLMKLLENNGLLNEERISYLIDLEKKNPAAINKLIKDSGLDPMDLDAEKAGDYKPNTYTVDDREMELDTVLDSIQDTPSYNRTLDIVSSKWDGASKQVIAGSPQLLKVINDHVQSGIYDTILKEVERERVFGRLTGLSDIDAYRQVGDAIQARGGFNVLTQGSSPSQSKPLAATVVVPSKPNQADEDKLKDKRRAAGSTKPAGSGAVVKEFNPLSMSDEEFSKSVNNKYL